MKNGFRASGSKFSQKVTPPPMMHHDFSKSSHHLIYEENDEDDIGDISEGLIVP